MAGGLSDLELSLASDMASFLRGGRGGGFSSSSPSWWRLPQDTDWNFEGGRRTGANMELLPPYELLRSGSINTELRSDEAD